jgi:SnoaL-like domain
VTTTTTQRTSTNQQDALAGLIDRAAIADLIHRLGVILDEKRFDELGSIFVPEATVTSPGGHAEGIDAIAAQARRNHRPDLHTQHLATDLVVDLDGDSAQARGNYIGVFATRNGSLASAPQFQIGSVYRFGLVRTTDGWRMRSMEMHPTWAAGNAPDGRAAHGAHPSGGHVTAARVKTRMEAAVRIAAKTATTVKLRAAMAVVSVMPQMACRPWPPSSPSP